MGGPQSGHTQLIPQISIPNSATSIGMETTNAPKSVLNPSIKLLEREREREREGEDYSLENFLDKKYKSGLGGKAEYRRFSFICEWKTKKSETHRQMI